MHRWFDDVRVHGGPVGRPLLVVSDIHGDLAALEAVLAEVEGLDLCGIVAAGDHCFGGPDPLGVWLRLQGLNATLVRGETDWALGAVPSEKLKAWMSADLGEEEQRRLSQFEATKSAMGDILCRRLADLPSTVVVSLDDRSGVMVLHGTPSSVHRSLDADMPEAEFGTEVACIAEDVLVVGRSHRGFVRRDSKLLVVGAGSVGQSEVVGAGGEKTAHAVLLAPFADGKVYAAARDVVVHGCSLAQVG